MLATSLQVSLGAVFRSWFCTCCSDFPCCVFALQYKMSGSPKIFVNVFSTTRLLVAHKCLTSVIQNSIPQLLMILCLKWWKAREQWDGEKHRYESLSKGSTVCLQGKVAEATFKETGLFVQHPSSIQIHQLLGEY